MLRKLLTLFVILSGLAAAGAPAQARIATLEEVRLEASSALGQSCSVARRQADARFGHRAPKVEKSSEVCLRPTITIRIPTVMLGTDRARE